MFLLVDRFTFVVDTSFDNLLKGVFGRVASSKSILLLITVAEVLRVVVRFFFGRFVVVLKNSSLLSIWFVWSVVVEGLGLAVIKTGDSEPKSKLATGFCDVTGTCSLKLASTKFELGKSPSLWNGSRSTHGERSIGARLPEPHRCRSFPMNSGGRKACGWRVFELPKLRQRICGSFDSQNRANSLRNPTHL